MPGSCDKDNGGLCNGHDVLIVDSVLRLKVVGVVPLYAQYYYSIGRYTIAG